MNNLAENVSRLRKQKGLSQAVLMQRTGVTSVKQIETGTISSPRYETLEALAKELGVEVADLYANPPEPRRVDRPADPGTSPTKRR